MLNLLSRWARTRAASPSTLERTVFGRSGADSLWQSLLRWIPGEADPWQPGIRHPADRCPITMADARAAFVACLDGFGDSEALVELRRSIRRARDLRALWHLRTWVYTEVARAHSQHEAERRLAGLNRHFPAGVAGRQALAAARRQRQHPH